VLESGCWAAAAAAALGACTASADDVRPPGDQLFFPTGLAVTPDEHFLFAANANSELRYDSGTISVVNLDTVQSVIDGWLATPQIKPDHCDQDPDFRETLVCDEAMFLAPTAGVRIGNFATDIAVQAFASGHIRVLVPTRGDPSISWADFDSQTGKLSCTQGSESFALCDDAHRLTGDPDDPDLGSIPNEPFGIFADSVSGFALVTHQTAGAVSLIDSPDGIDAKVVDIRQNLFAEDPLTLISASTGVSGRSPGSTDDLLYVGSRTENRIQTLSVGQVAGQAAYLVPSNYFFLDAVGATAGESFDTRAIQFSPDSARMYVVNRDPPSLQIYDTSLTDTGFPRNAAIGVSDICREASTASILDPGDGERAYVTCFQDGQIYVVDPRGGSQVEDIITVGRGPYGIAATKGASVAASGRKQLFVSNFLEDTIAVIDVTPTSVERNRVVLRIGTPRAP
jgi:YVTN family beta-propeller protein